MLTKRQKQILDFIKSFSRKNDISPTIDEIRKHFRLRSVATIHQHLEALKTKGYLDRSKNKTRSTAVSKGSKITQLLKRTSRNGFALVPFLGSANAGPAALFAEENTQGYLKVSRNIMNKNDGVFALRVEGDSMNDATIGADGESANDGDFVLIDSEYRTPKDGDYILSIIDGMANLKKFKRDENENTNEIWLMSESTNKRHKPICISSEDDYMINGKIISVIKK